MSIEDKFKEYKLVTKEIISKISGDEDIQHLMEKRDIILKSIFEKDNVDRSLVRKLYEELKIGKLDENLKEVILNEQIKIKEELKEIHTRKQANTTYNNQLGRISFLNKTI